MSELEKADWSKITLPREVTREETIRKYENAIEDLNKLNKEFSRYFKNKRKKAKTQMMTTNIFRAVSELVHFDGSIIHVNELLQFVTIDDRPLFADICKFTYQFYEGKPMNDWRLSQFKGLLTYYLCRVGF